MRGQCVGDEGTKEAWDRTEEMTEEKGTELVQRRRIWGGEECGRSWGEGEGRTENKGGKRGQGREHGEDRGWRREEERRNRFLF